MNELTIFKAIVLGLVQGLTEFLPISSSGHLVITQRLFGLAGDSSVMLLFDAMSHIGTLAAVMIVFAGTFRDYLGRLVRESSAGYTGRRTGWWISILGFAACVPTAIIGFGFKDQFEAAFDNITSTAVGLAVTGGLLFATRLVPRPSRGWRRIGIGRAVLVGIAQGCAILPGISRSGSTICMALFCGFKKPWAAQFSFFIAAPVILGAGLIKVKETLERSSEMMEAVPWAAVLVGTGVAFVSGMVALKVLIGLVIREKIHHFAWYCWGLSLVVLVWGLRTT